MVFLHRASARPLALGLVVSVVALGGLTFTTSHGLMAPLLQPTESTSTPTPAPTPGFGTVQAIKPGQTIGEVTAINQRPDRLTIHSIQDGSEVTYRVLDTTVFYAPPDRPYSFSLLNVGDRVQVQGGGRCPEPVAGQGGTPPPGLPCGGQRQRLGQDGPGQEGGALPEQPGLGRKRLGQAGLQSAGAVRLAGMVDGLPVARRVIVQPAGEARRGKGPAQGGVTTPGQPSLRGQPGLQEGVRDGTGQ
jgi:hypothetical protein